MNPPLQPGTLVRLRICPYGEPGIVQGMKHRLVLVEWRDLGMVGKHSPESLMVCPSLGSRH